MVGATGTGKTWYGPIWIWERIRERPGADGFIVARNYGHHVLELLFPYVEDWLRAVGEPYLPNRSRYTIFLPRYKSTIRFATDEAPEVMEGFHTGAFIWLDEAGLMHPRTWEIARRRAMLYDAPVLVTTIPYRAGWVKSDLFEQWRKGDPEITYVHLSWRDNPRFDPLKIEAERKKLPRHVFEAVYEGNWSKPFGMIFAEPDDSSLLVDEWPVAPGHPMVEVAEGLEIPEGWPLFSGHDYGFTAPTASVWGVLSPDDALTIVAVDEESNRTIERHVERWKAYGLDRTMWSWGDPANPGEWQTATDHGFPIDTDVGRGVRLNDVLYGIGVVTERLQTGRLKVLRGCDLWLQRREEYLWAPDPKTLGESLLEKPAAGEAEHVMDATRYLCVGLKAYRELGRNWPSVVVRKQTMTASGSRSMNPSSLSEGTA